jgi:P2 family phage contractile tail tube protein
MTARDIRTNFALFVDGRSYAGEAKQVTPPKLARVTEDFRAGGMNGTIKLDMGQEAMDADFTMSKYDLALLGMYGLAAGQTKAVTLREILESQDGTVKPVIHTMRGIITEMDPGTSEPGKPGELKLTWNLRYYKLQHGQTVVQEIDLENMVHIVNGVDMLAQQRAGLGI